MGSVTWKGTTIITDAEGVWTVKRGMLKRRWHQVNLPRALGEISKDMGMQGANHSVHVTFLEVTTANVLTIWNRLENLLTPANSGVGSGTLVIDSPVSGTPIHTINNCIFADCEPGEQTRAALLSLDNLSGSVVWNMDFALTFRQLRR